MQHVNLSEHSDESLFVEVKNLRTKERESMADLILYLHEIDKRGIHVKAGYSGLFAYCTQALGYSGASACRRAAAVKALSKSPEVYQKLKSGELTLCAISTLSKVLTEENTLEVLSEAQGKTKLEVEQIAAKLGAPLPARKKSIVVRKVVVPVAPLFSLSTPAAVATKEEVRFQVSMELNEEEMKLYQEAKELVGPLQAKEVVLRALREFVARRKKKAKVTPPAKSTSTLKVTKVRRSRYIPAEVRREVRDKCGGQCAFIGDGRRCTERHGLQLDHVQPFALGGGNYPENLRLMCPKHNRLLAEIAFPGKVPRAAGRC